MAYQSKKHRKFVATAVTAAVVASAVAPAAGFAAEKADFKDSIPSWSADAVDYLVGKKAIEGFEDGTFQPDGKLTRAQAATILAKTLGLTIDETKKTDFPDVKASHWASSAIAAIQAEKKGVINGDEKGQFNPEANITRQEWAKMIVTAYDLKLDENADVDFSDNTGWGKEFVEILASIGGVNGYDNGTFKPNANVTRAEAAVFVHRAEVEDVRLEVPQKPVTTPEVTSVSATNLKEVVVAFNTTVEKEDAEEKANYSLKSGKAIKSVALSEDKKSVTITVEGTLANNKADAVTVSNFLDAKNVEFTTVDNQLPEVASIKSLGTKSLKVVFSEPVTEVKQSNITLDGKAFFGKVELGANNRSVILTPFSTSALAAGDHKVTVSGVKDFAGFVSLSSTHDFKVVEDKDAPTVTEATATLESVTLTFSEDVDPSTISASKVYWKSGDSKKTATGTVEQLADNKFKYTFSTTNSLPTGKVDIYVEGVKDYSGNEIAKDTKVTVTPEIDQTRPEVKKVAVVDATTIKVTFSKAINQASAQEVKNYTVLNKDGKVVSVQSADLDPQDSKTVIIKLYTSLSTGENTLTIKNLKDNTKLQNTMLDYSEKIVRADKAAPYFDSKVVSTDDLRVVVKFNKKMNVDTLVDYSNYLVRINGQLQTLSSDIADVSVLQDGTAVAITFAETINGDDVVFASGATPATGEVNVQELHVLGLKDTAGNLLKEFADGTNVIGLGSSTVLALADFNTTDYAGKEAELVDTKTVKVKFNAGINAADAGAFSYKIGGVEQIEDVQVDGTSTVTLKFKNHLATDAAGLAIDINYSKLVTIAGHASGTTVANAVTTANLLDSVAPEVIDQGAYGVTGNVITITYSEALEYYGGSRSDLTDADFKVVRISDNKTLNPLTDYDVAIGGTGNKEVKITLTDSRTVSSAYRVTVDGAKYFQDLSDAENTVEDSVGQSVLVASTEALGLAALNAKLDAAGTATAPDYAAAGITGVTAGNIAAINTAVEAGKTAGVDLSKTAIQALVDAELLALKALTSFTAVTLTQTGGVAGGDVQYANAAAVIAALPATITVTLGDSSTVSVPVTWADTDTYNAGVAGTYTFTATWGTLPAGVNNSGNLAVPTVDLVVAP